MVIRRWPLVALAAIALALVLGRGIAQVHANRLWYDAMGAGDLWSTQSFYRVLVGALSSILAMVVIFFNLYAVRRSIVSLILPRRVANLEIGEEVPGRYLTAAVVGLSFIFGFMLDLPDNIWMSIIPSLHGTPFRETDPYFMADLGFFVYWLPLETALHLWALIVVLVATALVLFLYALTPGLKWERGTLHVSGYVRRHLAVLAGLLLLVLAWSYRLDGFQLLLDGSGPGGEFTSIDHRIGIRVAAILSFITAGAAIVVLWSGWVGQLPLVFGAVSIVLVLSFVLRQIIPALDVGGDRQPDPVARERPYVATRRGFTLRAFGVDRILTVDRSVAFRSPSEAAHGTPAWEVAALGRALGWSYGQGSAPSLTTMRMTGSGLIATALIAPPDTVASAPWIVASARATRVDARGAPIRVDHLGSPALDDETLRDVLVHPNAAGYREVADSLGTIPAPSLRGFGSRLAHAWSLQNLGLLRARGGGRQVIVARRDVRSRVAALAPFFPQGRAVSPLFVGDSLYWIVDLYATSGSYPLSVPVNVAGDSRRYVHHAATAIVAAATGEVRLLRAPEPDPIATTWFERFPDLFLDASEMPRELLALLPPIEDGASVQATVFARYGRRRGSPLGGEVAWETGADSIPRDPAPIRVVLPVSAPATTWIVPVLDSLEYLQGTILATGGATRSTLWLPGLTSPRRWSQTIERMRQVTDSAPPPREVLRERGVMRVIPIADDVRYVQTTYTKRPTTAPVIESVAVLTGDSLAVGRSLVEAFGGAPDPEEPAVVSARDFPGRVQALYSTMVDALRRGDLRAFGEAFDALGSLLQAVRPLAPPARPR